MGTVDERAALESKLERGQEELRSLERHAVLTPDPIERGRLKTDIEKLQRQLFEYRKRLDILTEELAPSGRKEHSPLQSTDHAEVFISYSHKDRKWLHRLLEHLEPLKREGHVVTWHDTQLAPGSLWRSEVEAALESARVAILLVSADYLASKYVFDEELPLVLERARSGGMLVLPIIISPCAYMRTNLASIQAVNSPSSPLVSKSRGEQDKIFTDVAQSTRRYLAHDAATR